MELHTASTKGEKSTESNQSTIKDYMDGNTICYLVNTIFDFNVRNSIFHTIIALGYIILCLASRWL